MILFRYMILCCFILIVASQPIAAQESEYNYSDFDRSYIQSGETLLYNAYIFGQLLPMGRAELTISQTEIEGKEYYLFSGHAKGGHLIFTVDLDLASYVDAKTLRPDFFLYKQTGFESRMRKLDFNWDTNEIIYSKKSREDDPYEQRARTPMQPATRDILSTLYFARSIEPVVGATKVMRLIEKRDIWTVDVSVEDKKEFTTHDGTTFDALLIKISPRETGDNALFHGLFGLKGNIRLWVTEDRRIPVQIEGDYMLGFINLHLTVVLKEWSPADAITGVDNDQTDK